MEDPISEQYIFIGKTGSEYGKVHYRVVTGMDEICTFCLEGRGSGWIGTNKEFAQQFRLKL